jgi:hypothetical protein
MRTIGLQDLNLHDIGNTIQMAGALFASEGKLFLIPLPLCNVDLEQVCLRMDEDDWHTFLRQTDLQEVENSAKAILRKSNRMIDTMVQWAVWRRDGFRCRYCKTNCAPLTVDHLILWEEGGPSTQDNMVSACRKCNKLRGNMPFHEWLASEQFARIAGDLTQTEFNRLRQIDLSKIVKVEHVRSR